MLVCGPLAASFSFFASALAAHFPLMGNSISFCPAAAFRGYVFAQGRRALGRNHLRHNRRNPPSITPTECANYQAMPNPNCIML
jgi:hypothetical protein